MTTEALHQNTWLVSNTTLYFSDRLLNGEMPINIYGLFDLSTLSEAILLADKIVTLPGRGIENSTAAKLKKQDPYLLEEIDVQEDIADIISSFQATNAGFEFILEKNDELAQIICDIFPGINERLALQAVNDAHWWASKTYRTPSWPEFGKAYVLPTLRMDDDSFRDFKELGIDRFTELLNKKDVLLTDTVSEVYVRALMYLRIAEDRDLLYCPDSIRVPIIAYIMHHIRSTLYRYSLSLIRRSDSARRQRIEAINEAIKANIFRLEIPSSLSSIVKSCLKEGKSKESFVDKALQIRNSKDYTKFRKWLADAEGAVKQGDVEEFERMKKKAESIFSESSKSNTSEIVNQITVQISPKDPFGSLSIPVGRIVDSAIQRIIQFFSRKNLVILNDPYKHLSQFTINNKHLEEFFGGSLDNSELNLFKNLNVYRENYTNDFDKTKNRQ
jgi:hypothetical protein